MTSPQMALEGVSGTEVDAIGGAPNAELTVAPRTLDEAATILDAASEHGLRVLIWGGGTHQGIGGRVDPDVILSTSRLNELADYQPEDLTVVVGGGMPVADLEARLAERGQTAVLPEDAGAATVGGVVASGTSGWRRLRYGPTRDRMLEVVLATGDGRIVRGGGRVVKNVTGYDLPRLATGSLGSLGVIMQVCLKLWPLPSSTATVTLANAEAPGDVYRPLAMISDRDTTRVYLGGHAADVEAQAAAVAGEVQPGLDWPDPISGEIVASLRVPPRLMADAIGRVPSDRPFLAEHRVGRIQVGFDGDASSDLADLRSWAENVGGALVIDRAPDLTYRDIDPWGTPPASLDLQRRVVSQFDPLRVLNPGRLPGGL